MFQWTVTGAAIQGSATSQQVQVKLPDQVGAAVTLNVKVSLPDGATTTGTYSFQTISTFAADIEQMACKFAHTLFATPLKLKPDNPDPWPDIVAQINPADLVAIRDAAASMVNVANAALKANAPITLAPGVPSVLATRTPRPIMT